MIMIPNDIINKIIKETELKNITWDQVYTKEPPRRFYLCDLCELHVLSEIHYQPVYFFYLIDKVTKTSTPFRISDDNALSLIKAIQVYKHNKTCTNAEKIYAINKFWSENA